MTVRSSFAATNRAVATRPPRWAPWFRWVASGVIAMVLGHVNCAWSQAPESPPADQPRAESTPDEHAVRRIFVPTEAIGQLPGRFVPVERSVLQERLDAAARKRARADDANVWVRAKHQLEYDGNDHLTGVTTMQVAADSTADWQLLCSNERWAIHAMEWMADEARAAGGAEASTATPAIYGTDSLGRVWVLVDRSGALRIEWSAPVEYWDEQRVACSIPVDAHLGSEITLSAPLGWRPVATESAVVRPAGLLSRSWREGTTTHGAWHIAAGPDGGDGGQPLLLARVSDRDAEVASVWQRTLAQVTPGGILVSVEWSMADHGHWFDGLDVLLPPGAQVRDVWRRGRPVAWTIQPSESGAPARLVADGGEPVSFEAASLLDYDLDGIPDDELEEFSEWRLEALVPLEIGTLADLPRVHLNDRRARDFVAIDIDSPLTLLDFQTQDATYLGATTSPGERHRFRIDSPQGQLQVAFGWEPAELEARIGSTVELGANLLDATVVVDVTSTRGECFEVMLAVSDEWDVDAVRAIDGTTVTSWNVIELADDSERSSGVQSPEAAETARPARRLVIRLREPIGTGASRALEIRAQRRGTFWPGDRGLSLADCWPLDVEHARPIAAHLAVRAIRPYRLTRQSDPGVQWLEPSQLTEQERRLVNLRAGDWLLAYSAPNRALRFQLTPDQAEYQVDVSTRVSVLENRIAESYRLTVSSAGPVRELAIRCAPRREGPLTWNLEGVTSRQPIVARRVDPTDQADDSGETWFVEIPESTESPLTIIAERDSVRADQSFVSLMAVPGAAQQTSVVQVNMLEGEAPHLVTHGSLQAIDVDDPLQVAPPAIQRRYTYSPASLDSSRLEIQRSSDESLRQLAWSWVAHAHVYWSTTGQVLVRVDHQVENVGQHVLRLEGPDQASITAVTIDGQPANLSERESATVVELPVDRRFFTLSISQQLLALPGPLDQRLALRVVQPPFPVLKWRWSVWLPAGYQGRPIDVDRLAAARDWLEYRPLLFGDIPPVEEPPDLEELFRQWGAEFDVNVGRTNWHSILSAWRRRWAGTPSGDRWNVWIDPQLALEGWESHSETDRQQDGAERIRAVLRRNGQSVLVGPREVAIVGRAYLTRHRQALRATTRPETWVSRRTLESTGSATSGRGELWSLDQLLAVTRGPAIWTLVHGAPAPYVVLNAWNLVESATVGPELSMRVYRPVAVRLWSVAVFLAVLGVLRTFSAARNLRWIALALPALALTWWLLPLPYQSICEAIIAALLVHALATIATTDRADRSTSSGTALSGTTLAPRGVVMLVLLPASWHACATSMSAGDQKAPRTAEWATASDQLDVVIPTDDQGNPTGDYVWVSDDWLRSHAADADNADDRPDWLHQRVLYECYLNPSLGGGQVMDALRVTFDLRTFQSATSWEIPFPAHRLRWVSIDGRPIDPARWSLVPGEGRTDAPAPSGTNSNADADVEAGDDADANTNAETRDDAARGERVVITIPGAGTHEVTVELEAPVTVGDGELHLAMPVPPLANSTVVVRYPVDARPPVFEGDSVQVVHQSSAGTSIAHLGSAPELLIRWDATAGQQRPRVHLLTWAYVEATGVRVELHAQLVSPDPPRGELKIESDTPLPAQSFSIPWRPIDPDGVYRLTAEFQLRPTDQDQNRWRLPRFTSTSAEVENHLVAFTFHPRVRCVADWFDQSAAISRQAFDSRWGVLRASPDGPNAILAADDRDRQPRWFETRPERSRPSVRTLTHHAVALDEVVSDWEAIVQPMGPAARDHRLRVPSDWTLDTLQVYSAGQQVPSHWVRSAPDRVRLFLHADTGSDYHLIARGRRERTVGTARELPEIVIEDADVTRRRVRILRGAGALVDVEPPEGEPLWQPTFEPSPGEWLTPLASNRWLVADVTSPVVATSTNAAALSPRVTTRPDDSEFEHQADLSITSLDGQWHWTLRHQVRVVRGTVDQIGYELPSTWVGAIESAQNVTVDLRPTPIAGWAQVLVQAPRSGTDQTRFELSGTIEAQSGEPLRIPPLKLLTAGEYRLRVQVPKRVGNQQLSWQARGARQIPAPESSSDAASSPTPEQDEVYEVESPDFGLASSVLVVPGTPRVRMREVWLDWSNSGSIGGWVSLDFPASGARECLLRIPAGMRLVSVMTRNTPTVARQVAPREWQLALPGGSAPQQLRIVFSMESRGAERLQLELPQLTDLDHRPWQVAETLLTVVLDGVTAAVLAGGDWRPLSDIEIHERRLDALRDLAPSAIVSGTATAPEGFASWRQRFAALRWRLDAATPRLTPRGIEPLGANSGSAAFDNLDAIELSRQLALAQLGHVSQFGSQGAVDRVTLYSPSVQRRWLRVWGALAALGGIWAVMYRWLNQLDESERLRSFERWAPQLTLLAGIVLAWTLAPSWLGWAIAAMGAAWIVASVVQRGERRA